jgi:hypothetical protein
MGNDMPQNNRSRKFSLTALCAAFGIVLVIASGSAVFAADNNEDDDLPDVKFVKGLLRSLGLRNGQEAGIDYQERPPLVVPPSRDLPVPAAAGSLATTNPAWPSDPDEKRRRAERKARAELRHFNPDPTTGPAGDPLKPDELAAGKTNKPAMKTSQGDASQHSPEMTPSELGFSLGMWNSLLGFGKVFGKETPETATFAREPARNALTDPPVGYRTPSPAAPYGIDGKVDKQKAVMGDRQSGDIGK